MSQLLGTASIAAIAVVVGKIDGILETVVLVGAAVAALGILQVRVVRPTIQFIGRVDRTLDDLKELGGAYTRLGNVEDRVGRLEGNVEGINKSLGSLAASERRTVKNALDAA